MRIDSIINNKKLPALSLFNSLDVSDLRYVTLGRFANAMG